MDVSFAVQSPQKPLAVSNYQAKVALDHFGFLEPVEAIMADAATPKKIKLAWENATFKRYSDMILNVAAMIRVSDEQLGLSDEQIDELFEYASNVE